MRLKLEISGTKEVAQKISYTEKAYDVDTWSATLPRVVDIAELATMEIFRERTSVLTGRVLSPTKGHGRGGSSMPISGWGYDGNLKRFITGDGTITNKTVVDALQEILDESPSAHGITLGDVDTFYFSSAPQEYKTTVEFLKWAFDNTGIEFDPTNIEVANGIPDGANNNTIPGGWLRNSFADIRGRIFIFWSDGANNVKFNSTPDGGTTWAGVVDTTYNSSNGIIDITYSPAHDDIHMAIYTGARTELYRGTITVAAIAWVLQNNNIFSANRSPISTLMYGNEDDHVWTIDSTNRLWESVDDGANWTDHGLLTETAKFALPHATGDPGDTYLIEYDAVNDVLELWWWDDSTTTEAYIKDLYDFGALGDVMEYLTATLGHDGCMHIHCNDDDNNVLYIMIETDETVTVDKTAVAALVNASLTIFSDNGDSAYLLHNSNLGGIIRKYTKGVFISSTAGYGTAGANQQSPIKNKIGFNDPGGFVMEGGNGGGPSVINMDLIGPTGIRLARGHSTGSFKTDLKTATGAFERWGLLNALEIVGADILYDVEDGAAVDYATGLQVMADLHAEGVPDVDTTIMIQGNITRSGAEEPYMQELYLSERVDEIESLTYSHENLDAWLKKLVKYCGAAEYDLSTSDELTFVAALGTDRSDTITLEQGVNCEEILVEPDYRSYANCVMVVGDAVDGAVKDTAQITANGEWWTTLRDKDITTDGMIFNRGATALPVLASVVNRISVKFFDWYDPGLLRRGDTVTVVHPKTGLSEAARFVDITHGWSLSGEKTSGNLVNSQRIESLFDYLADLDDIRRQL